MPALKNQKHENFAQLIVHGAAQGLTQAQMYKLAGYRAEGHAAAMAASRLMKNDDIRRRVAEIGAPAARKAAITAESLIEDFDAVIAGASRKDQWSAVNRAIELRGKLKGFLIDHARVEIGMPGTFSSLATPQEVVDQMILESRDPHALVGVLESMLQMARERLSNMAVPVVTSTAPKVKPTSEADRAVEIFRPKRRTG
jgi:hypothetical protein